MNTKENIQNEGLQKKIFELQILIRKIKFGEKEKNVKKIKKFRKEIARLKTRRVFNLSEKRKAQN